MKQITARELQEFSVSQLGLDPSSLDLTSVEGIAGALRRAAGFLCPCSENELIGAVARSLQDLMSIRQELRSLIDRTLEALIAYGDLVESGVATSDGAVNKGPLIYLTPPSFVPREDGSVFLLGIAPDDVSPLPADYAARIDYDGHVRRIHPLPEETLRLSLPQFGLFKLSMEQWLRTPSVQSQQHYVLRFDELLTNAPAAGSITGLRILDPARPVRYYQGRWIDLVKQTGRYLARRPQAYGSQLWCYIEVEDGHTARLVDLPQFEKRWRACDEAWRLQAARDACNLKPQQYRIRSGPSNSTAVLDLFSPVPLWMQRRWDFIGCPVPPSGSLLSYVLPTSAIAEEITFMKTMLWLVDSREAG